jgi:glycosyltransferase involved in cell wall biosynthesis
MPTDHAIFFLCYNHTDAQFDLCRRSFDTVLAQDIGPLRIFVVNNGSAQPTRDWLDAMTEDFITVHHYGQNTAPTIVANMMVGKIFSLGYPYLLSVPSDGILPPNLYSQLAKWPRGFVAAWMNNGEHTYTPTAEAHAVSEDIHPSVVLTRKWAYDALVAKDGYFLDENYFMYANDVDMKLRMAACGIRGVQLDIQCGHWGSVCWRLNTPENAKIITDRANGDRLYFFRKWGIMCGDGRFFNDPNFRGEPQ